MKKFALILAVGCGLLQSFAGDVTVTAVTARQRYPWNGLVDIAVTMQGSAADVALADCIFVATNSETKAAISMAHIEPNGEDVGSGTTWTRKFIWDAKTDVGAVKIEDVSLMVEAMSCVQLWEDGPYWAECNVGALKPEEYGYYFWWGDTVGYVRSKFDWVPAKNGASYLLSEDNCPTYCKNDSQLRSAGYIDATGNLVAAHDAATAHLGASWRMPTLQEMDALVNKCTTTWTTRNGVAGRLVTGKGAYASRSIFLPAAGYGVFSDYNYAGSAGEYWSSTPYYAFDAQCAWDLSFGSDSFGRSTYGKHRHCGGSVRPVRGFAK